jgi:hypothetical protein
MQSAISISEILGTIDDGRVEVCATADADYDPAKEKVSVKLDAFTRRVSVVGDGRRLPEPWLPPGEQVTEHLPREEAFSFSKDVFRSWIRKVRATVPGDRHLRS